MSIIVKDTGSGDFQIPEAVLHNAVCTAVFDLGLQPGYQGQIKHKVVICWELAERISDGGIYDGQRFVVSNTYTASLNERANLRAMLESWRSRGFEKEELEGFDIAILRTVPCTISIVHNKNEKTGRTFANADAVMKHDRKLGETMECELPANWMPDWIKKKLDIPIVDAEYVEITQEFEDDIPFNQAPFVIHSHGRGENETMQRVWTGVGDRQFLSSHQDERWAA